MADQSPIEFVLSENSSLQFKIHWFEELGSTNTTARQWVQEGAPEGTVIIAGRQTAGRGRQGRSWASLPGALLLSLILRPPWPPSWLPRLGFYACAAAALSAERQGLPCGWLKWPNDLVVGRLALGVGRSALGVGRSALGVGRSALGVGRLVQTSNTFGVIPGETDTVFIPSGLAPDSWDKWGGVLVEAGAHPQQGAWAIIGIGLNLGSLEGVDPFDRPPGSASLSDAVGRTIEMDNFLNSFLKEFAGLYGDGLGELWETTLDYWRKRDVLWGKSVQADCSGQAVEGVARGINNVGALGIDTPDGRVWVEAGEVHLSIEW